MPQAQARTLLQGRALERKRERESRQRRIAKLAAMRATVAALERALPVMLTLDSDNYDDVQWEGFLDRDAMRVRQAMRASIRLFQQTQQLEMVRVRLQHLLHEHRIASRVLAGMLCQEPVDDWYAKVLRWQALARQHYKPWTLDECQDEMDAALKEVNAFQWSSDKQSSGARFFGWRDSRRVDHLRGALQFQFQKTFRGHDIMDYVNVGWAAYTDTLTYYDVIIGPRARVVQGVAIGEHIGALHEVIQELGDDIKIIRNDEWYPDVAVDAHIVYLVFRVRTERGVTLCVRSICCPELIKAVDGPQDVWPSNFMWFVWERLDDEDRHDAYTLRIGGSMMGNDLNYVNQWLLEALGCVLRSERLATGRQLLTSSS